MQPGRINFCPFIGDTCIETGCKMWIHVIGNNPQTGNPVDHFDCSFRWLPTLLIEATQMERQTAAAVESFRNEMVKQPPIVLADIPNNGKIEDGRSTDR
jgi:hypothetical protein